MTAGEPAVACTGAPPAIEAAVDLMGSGALWAELLLTHPLPLAELPAALPRMRSGTGLKVQVLPH